MRKKKKGITLVKRGLLRCNVLWSARLDFCAIYLFSRIFIDFHFMMFTKISMEDLMLVLNKNNKNEHAEYHGIFIPYNGNIYTKNKGVTFLFCLGQTLWMFNVCMKILNELCVSIYSIYKNSIAVPHFYVKTFHSWKN